MSLESQKIICVDCNTEFEFTQEEADYYNSKSLQFLPKRCKACRLNRRAGTKKMFTYICSECGGDAVVPFQSDGLRPVLCSECFAKR